MFGFIWAGNGDRNAPDVRRGDRQIRSGLGVKGRVVHLRVHIPEENAVRVKESAGVISTLRQCLTTKRSLMNWKWSGIKWSWRNRGTENLPGEAEENYEIPLPGQSMTRQSSPTQNLLNTLSSRPVITANIARTVLEDIWGGAGRGLLRSSSLSQEGGVVQLALSGT
jgi:hypothetical protein